MAEAPETSDEVIERFADRPLSGEEALASLELLSAAEMHERHGTRPLTDEEFERVFGDLPDGFGTEPR